MERLEHGGIPVFWERGTGEAMAAILFRGGIADELPHRRGETHLVEHLALFALGRRAYDYNGFVDPLFTVFHARGSHEEVTGFLTDICRSLGDLPLERFETEVEILRTEAGADAGHFAARVLAYRLGVTGFGVDHLTELGLKTLGPGDVAARRDAAFTAGNAAVWMFSPEPPQLELELPDGPSRPPPPAEPVPGYEFPAWIASGTLGAGVSMFGMRSSALSLGIGVLAERLHQRLRLDEGLAYAVEAGRYVLSADLTHILVSADCQDRNAPAVAAALLEEFERFTSDGPTQEELDDLHRRADRVSPDDPDALKQGLDYAATEELLGGEPLDREALARLRREVTPEAARSAVHEASESRLVIVPDTCPRPDGDHQDLERAPQRFEGRVYESLVKGDGNLVIVDDAGVYLSDGGSTEISIPAPEVAFVTRGRGGVLRVIGRDMSWVEVDPRRFRDGDDAAATIARLAGGEECVIPDEPEAAAAVDQLADEQLPGSQVVMEELDALPGTFEPGELPEAMAHGAFGGKSGLVVLTDRRLLFVSKQAAGEEFVELPRAKLEAAEARSSFLGNTGLRVQYDGRRFDFKGIEPKQRAGEIADLLDDVS